MMYCLVVRFMGSVVVLWGVLHCGVYYIVGYVVLWGVEGGACCIVWALLYCGVFVA